MENTQKTNTKNFKPKAYTFFIVPFYYNGIWDDIHEKISRWQPIQDDMYSEDILYPYIIGLFKKEGGDKDCEDSTTNKLKIYQLNTKDEGSRSEFFFDRILGKKQVTIIEQDVSGTNSPKAIPFRFLNDGNNAPHLFISPSAKIGMMTLCVELGDGCTIQDLQQFNYCLHKRNETDNVIIESEELSNGRLKTKKSDKRTKNYRIICPSPETQKSLSDEEITNSVNHHLSIDGYKQLVNEKQNINDTYINWDLNFFTHYLLNTFQWNSPIKYFNKERMHVYTFCSLDDTTSQNSEITTEDIIPTAMRLSRVVNSKYLLHFNKTANNDSLLQTYQNIYFSSAIEGTAMVCVAKDVNKEFVGTLQNMFNRQYLIIYLLVLIQRYTLLSIERKLTEYDALNDNSDKELWDLINLVCKIKVNCYYTDVSVYTHHSQFYQYCCKNLHIPETLKEIDEKVKLLKLTTDRQTQQLIEEQKRLQEEEERERKIENNEAERRQNILNFIVAILTVAQVVQAVYELWSPDPQKDIKVPLLTGIVCLALLIWIGRKDLIKLWNKNN